MAHGACAGMPTVLVHSPLTHLLQDSPQPPQLALSVCSSTHLPLHEDFPDGQPLSMPPSTGDRLSREASRDESVLGPSGGPPS